VEHTSVSFEGMVHPVEGGRPGGGDAAVRNRRDGLTSTERKALPVMTAVVDYFPDALLEVATASLAGQAQHLAGTPLRWDRTKSTDEADALLRHLIDRGTRDTDGVRHSAKVAWRALALLQREIESEAR